MTRTRMILAMILTYMIFAMLLNSVGTVILQSIQGFGISKTDASLLEAFKDLPIAVVSFLTASLLPRLGYRRAMMLGLTLVAIACVLMPLLKAFWATKLLFATVGAFSPSFWLSSERGDAAAVQRTRLAQGMVEAGHPGSRLRRGTRWWIAAGDREAWRGDIGCDDLGRARVAGGDDRQAADRTAAGDEDALAGQRSRLRHRMQTNRQRFGKGGLAHREPRRDREGLMLVDHDLVAEGALHVRKAHRASEEAHVEALMARSLKAIAASSAGVAWVDGDAVARLHANDARPHGNNRPRHLMAEDHRLLQPHGAEAAMLEVVQVGAADAAAAHLDAQLARQRRRGFDLLDAQVVGGVDHECFHADRCESERGGHAAVDIEDMAVDEFGRFARQDSPKSPRAARPRKSTY